MRDSNARDYDNTIFMWRLRLRMSQQVLFGSIRLFSETNECMALRQDMHQEWCSGFHPDYHRMLPDFRIVAGGPTETDLKLRDEIIETVAAKMKMQTSPYKITLEDWEMQMKRIGLYRSINDFFARDWTPQDATKLETEIQRHTLWPEYLKIEKPLDKSDYDNCEI